MPSPTRLAVSQRAATIRAEGARLPVGTHTIRNTRTLDRVVEAVRYQPRRICSMIRGHSKRDKVALSGPRRRSLCPCTRILINIGSRYRGIMIHDVRGGGTDSVSIAGPACSMRIPKETRIHD